MMTCLPRDLLLIYRNPKSDSYYAYTRFSLSVENEQSDARRDGTGRPNMSREVRLSVANGVREKSVSLFS